MKWRCEKCVGLNPKKANFCQSCGEKKTIYVVPADQLMRNSFEMLNTYANGLRILTIGGLLFGMIMIVHEILYTENLMLASFIGLGMTIAVILFLGVAEILDWFVQIEKENYQMSKKIQELTQINEEILNWIKLKHK